MPAAFERATLFPHPRRPPPSTPNKARKRTHATLTAASASYYRPCYQRPTIWRAYPSISLKGVPFERRRTFAGRRRDGSGRRSSALRWDLPPFCHTVTLPPLPPPTTTRLPPPASTHLFTASYLIAAARATYLPCRLPCYLPTTLQLPTLPPALCLPALRLPKTARAAAHAALFLARC